MDAATTVIIAILLLTFLLWVFGRSGSRAASGVAKASPLRAQLQNIPRMSGAEFEHYMADVFKSLGYNATVLGGAGDQGVDLLLHKGHERVAVQCKNYRRPVGNTPVQQVFAGKQHYGVNRAWVVAPAGFTKGAFALARTTGVLLFDYSSIERLIQQVEQQAKEQHVSDGHITDSRDRGPADSENKQQVSERSGPGETTGGTIRTRGGNDSQVNATAKQKSAKQELPPINFSGGGRMATEPFDLESGLAIFRLTHQGDEYFSATLMEQNGHQAAARDSLLASIVGPFDGSKAIETRAGQHVLDVQARAPWTITIEQPRPSSAPQTTSFQGNSQTATDFFELSQGLKKFEMTHQEDGYFSVTLLNKDGQWDSLLASQVGPFDGSKAVRIPKNDVYLLQVETRGPWTIQVQ